MSKNYDYNINSGECKLTSEIRVLFSVRDYESIHYKNRKVVDYIVSKNDKIIIKNSVIFYIDYTVEEILYLSSFKYLSILGNTYPLSISSTV